MQEAQQKSQPITTRLREMIVMDRYRLLGLKNAAQSTKSFLISNGWGRLGQR